MPKKVGAAPPANPRAKQSAPASVDAAAQHDGTQARPAPSPLAAHAACLEREAAWFGEVLELRLRQHAGEALGDVPPAPPPLHGVAGPYAELLGRLALGPHERLLLILAALPHLRPHALDAFFIQNRALERRFTEFGGLIGQAHGGFLPTGETAMFLLGGDDLAARLAALPLFDPEHPLCTAGVLQLEPRHPEEPRLAAALTLTPEYRERLLTGRDYRPPFSTEFPAQRISTPYDWSELVLDDVTRGQVEEIVAWARYETVLLQDWGLARRIKPGYRALFYGPPGTGKTLTASLLGKEVGRPVYRIDLSKVVSKYIGETEKNLANLFDQAQHRDWILFFDEAEALFGQRTESHNANDRAANQQVSYLLQRIEDFPGIAILATNLRSHLDEAFARRFQAMIRFQIPDAEQRLRLWQDHFRDRPYRLAPDVDLARIATDYALSGGAIVNVLRHAALQAVARAEPEIARADLLTGIRREQHKEGQYVGG